MGTSGIDEGQPTVPSSLSLHSVSHEPSYDSTPPIADPANFHQSETLNPLSKNEETKAGSLPLQNTDVGDRPLPPIPVEKIKSTIPPTTTRTTTISTTATNSTTSIPITTVNSDASVTTTNTLSSSSPSSTGLPTSSHSSKSTSDGPFMRDLPPLPFLPSTDEPRPSMNVSRDSFDPSSSSFFKYEGEYGHTYGERFYSLPRKRIFGFPF